MRARHGVTARVAAAVLLLGSALISVASPPVLAQSAPPDIQVNLLSQGEPASLDPNRTSFAFAVDAGVIRQVFEPLLRFDGDGIARPAAADRYDVSSDGTVYTFHLRPDGRWSDGQPVTAAQFEYSWKRLLDPRLNADYAAFFVNAGIVGADDYNAGRVPTAGSVGVRAVDGQTFEVRLSRPFGALPQLAALWVGAPLRPDLVDANTDGWAQDPRTYIGNGPFMVRDWLHQMSLTLVPNPAYTAHGIWAPPTVSSVTVTMSTSPASDYAAYLRDERAWALVPDSELNSVLNTPELAAQARAVPELATFWLQLNTGRPPLDNLDLRHALGRALDRRALVDDLTGGVSQPTTGVLPPGMPGFDPAAGRDLDFDPGDARALLAQAGYPDGDGLPALTFTVPNTPASVRRAEYLRARWRDVLGIDVQVMPVAVGAYQQTIDDRAFDLAFGGWAANYPDPHDWFGPNFACSGRYNYYAYCNPGLDQLLARGEFVTDLPVRLESYAEAHAALLRDIPVIPLFVRGRLVVVKPWVQTVGGGPPPFTALDEAPGSAFLDRIIVAPGP
jgi:oligopeptide transport system substrate-binding protein